MNAWTLLPAATLRRIAAAALRMSVGVALLSSP